MGKIKTIGEKIDAMIASYEQLNREAHEMIDLYIDERRLECPGIPIGAMKQMEINQSSWLLLECAEGVANLKRKKMRLFADTSAWLDAGFFKPTWNPRPFYF